MALLAEIQNECVAKDGSVSRMLRLCLLLAARLKHESFKVWALHELNGYPDEDKLPKYRVFQTRSVGYFANQVNQCTLEIPRSVMFEPLRTRFGSARLIQPISQYEELLTGNLESLFQLPWPREFALRIGPKVTHLPCLKVWQELPRSALASLIDTVKTRVLSLILDIEAENPKAGERLGSVRPISDKKLTQLFNKNIHFGHVNKVAAIS